MLKEEYPELDMSKLEAGVQRYMAEIGQANKEHRKQDQVEAPLDGAQEGEAGGRTFEVGQGYVPPPPGITDLPPLEMTDPLPSEAVDPLNP